jgi:carbamate kinase
MRILLALGGGALLRPGEPASAANRRLGIEAAARAIAEVAAEREAIVTHRLDATGDGGVAHLLELALRNALPDRDVVSVLTEVVVAADDPAFLKPSKPIGPVYSEAEASRLRTEEGWAMGRGGDGYRRLVPSPDPHAIAEIRSLRTLVDSGALLICAGASRTPVALDERGTLRAVEAMVDEDLTSALLARRLDADMLLMLTDLNEVQGAAGSTGPKVEATRRFVEATGRGAAIGSLQDAGRLVRQETGTRVESRSTACRSR